MTDIQRARDVLAKWRADGSEFKLQGGLVPLIAGLGGNPELLDALDGLLAQEQRRRTSMHDNMSHELSHHATRIAAAIIAADERMNA